MRIPEAVAAMPCPVCKIGLHMSDRQGVEIDYCPQCRGVWLDRGELDKIIDRNAREFAPAQDVQPQQPPSYAGGTGPSGLEGLADVARDMLKGRTYDDDRRHGDRDYGSRYGKKRKKSFLEQIFD